jgi:hypothetical protein
MIGTLTAYSLHNLVGGPQSCAASERASPKGKSFSAGGNSFHFEVVNTRTRYIIIAGGPGGTRRR